MKILIPVDASENSRSSYKLLRQLPLPATCDVTILTVMETESFKHWAVSPTEKETAAAVQDELRAEARRLLALESDRAKDTSWDVKTLLREGDPAQQIIDVANSSGVDLIALGSRGLGRLKRFLLGSVSSNVAKYADCSVLIAPAVSGEGTDVESGFAVRGLDKGARVRILVAFDGSDPAWSAVKTLASLPIGNRADIRLLTVLPVVMCYRIDIQQRLSDSWRQQKRVAKRSLEDAADQIRRATPHVTVRMREGQDISHEILSEADEWPADVVIMGHKSMSKIESALMGSVASRVAHHAHCGVWIVRN